MLFHYTIETARTVEETVKACEESCQRRKLSTVGHLNIPLKLLEKGINLPQQYRILEVYHPDVAKKVLSYNQVGGLFLTYKIAVYKDRETGKTTVGLVRPTVLMELVDDDRLVAMVQDVEAALLAVLDEVKG
ncbi:DUF302 domain-containing protein [Numidum massiliense]|uniref:DUF302 domain-containing protein n=1 Tax=Numidum massiliense TaxID=1522315 RepID=UPI0006D57A38|nr:DUF302 domain-containing protein [Numidum massiliense]